MQMGSPSENAVTQHDIAAFHIEFPPRLTFALFQKEIFANIS